MYAADYVVDVDGTLTFHDPNRTYRNMEPNLKMIEVVNKLYDEGNTILLYTARGNLSRNGDIHLINLEVRPVLEAWLHKHGVKYTWLLMGKPYARKAYIDDKGMNPEQAIRELSK